MKKGKTPVLNTEEARALLDAIDVSTLIGLRDRALIGLRLRVMVGDERPDIMVEGAWTYFSLRYQS